MPARPSTILRRRAVRRLVAPIVALGVVAALTASVRASADPATPASVDVGFVSDGTTPGSKDVAASPGTVAPSARIIGGSITRISRHPYQVALVDRQGQFCGGTVIDAVTVLTAAHCVQRKRPAGVGVLAGATNLNRGAFQYRSVTAIVRHPRYAHSRLGDIAIVIVDRPFRYSPRVRPLALASSADLAGARRAVVTGWGITRENGNQGSVVLRQVRVPLVDDDTCRDLLGINRRTEMCAGGSGVDTCAGDSGGPLVIRDENSKRRLAGITSWGDGCARTPGVYTEVPAYLRWIERHRGGS